MASPAQLTHQIRQLDIKFHRACKQVQILNAYIIDHKQRYQRAVIFNTKGFRYNIRLQMSVLEGVRNMMYEYASHKCDEIENLQAQLRQLLEFEDVTDSESEYVTDSESEDVTDSDEN